MLMMLDEVSRLWNSAGARAGPKEQSPIELFLLESYNGKIYSYLIDIQNSVYNLSVLNSSM